jgi:hypothetical protein
MAFLMKILAAVSLFLGDVMALATSKRPPPGYTYEYVTVGKHAERRLIPIPGTMGRPVVTREKGFDD